MYVAMNNFKVAEDKAEDFERAWRERQSYLAEVPGFVQFALHLRRRLSRHAAADADQADISALTS